jgi:uncharacterized cupredoxin-like copper-binding protein
MRPLRLIALAVLLTGGLAGAQAPDWAQASTIEIDMANFKFTPDMVNLKHGQPYRLRFVNKAGGGHDFAAREFFAAAMIAPEDRGHIKDGEVRLAGGETVDLRLLAPAAGTYKAHCSHFMHSSFGMKARILVQ